MFETEIARGVALLDERRPGWWTQIDLDRLDMSQGLFYEAPRGRYDCGCICAQTGFVYGSAREQGFEAPYGSFCGELDALGIGDRPEDYGFHCGRVTSMTDMRARYVALTAEWREVILRLRDERAPAPVAERAAEMVLA